MNGYLGLLGVPWGTAQGLEEFFGAPCGASGGVPRGTTLCGAYGSPSGHRGGWGTGASLGALHGAYGSPSGHHTGLTGVPRSTAWGLRGDHLRYYTAGLTGVLRGHCAGLTGVLWGTAYDRGMCLDHGA